MGCGASNDSSHTSAIRETSTVPDLEVNDETEGDEKQNVPVEGIQRRKKLMEDLVVDSPIFLPMVPPRVAIVPYIEIAECIKKGTVLGEGGFGTVHLCEWRQQDVAVKILRNLDKNKAVGDFIREVMVLSTMGHSHLVRMMAVSCDTQNQVLLYELMAGGSIADRLFLAVEEYESPGTGLIFDWAERMVVIYDACVGLACLHECELLHCDIKPENILIRANGRAALADFGLTRTCQSQESSGSDFIGFTPGYDDPAWWKHAGARKYTQTSDIYALGVVFMQVVTGLGAGQLRAVDKEAANKPSRKALKDQVTRFTETATTCLQSQLFDAHEIQQVSVCEATDEDRLQVMRELVSEIPEWPTPVSERVLRLAIGSTKTEPGQRPKILDILCGAAEMMDDELYCDAVYPLMKESEEHADPRVSLESAKAWGSDLRAKLETAQKMPNKADLEANVKRPLQDKSACGRKPRLLMVRNASSGALPRNSTSNNTILDAPSAEKLKASGHPGL